MRSALERWQVPLDLPRELDDVPPMLAISASDEDPVTDVARFIRDFLAVSQDERQGRRGKYDALKAWRTAIQELGVVV